MKKFYQKNEVSQEEGADNQDEKLSGEEGIGDTDTSPVGPSSLSRATDSLETSRRRHSQRRIARLSPKRQVPSVTKDVLLSVDNFDRPVETRKVEGPPPYGSPRTCSSNRNMALMKYSPSEQVGSPRREVLMGVDHIETRQVEASTPPEAVDTREISIEHRNRLMQFSTPPLSRRVVASMTGPIVRDNDHSDHPIETRQVETSNQSEASISPRACSGNQQKTPLRHSPREQVASSRKEVFIRVDHIETRQVEASTPSEAANCRETSSEHQNCLMQPSRSPLIRRNAAPTKGPIVCDNDNFNRSIETRQVETSTQSEASISPRTCNENRLRPPLKHSPSEQVFPPRREVLMGVNDHIETRHVGVPPPYDSPRISSLSRLMPLMRHSPSEQGFSPRKEVSMRVDHIETRQVEALAQSEAVATRETSSEHRNRLIKPSTPPLSGWTTRGPIVSDSDRFDNPIETRQVEASTQSEASNSPRTPHGLNRIMVRKSFSTSEQVVSQTKEVLLSVNDHPIEPPSTPSEASHTPRRYSGHRIPQRSPMRNSPSGQAVPGTNEVLPSVSDHSKHHRKLVDRFDVFGKMIALKMRDLPYDQKRLAEKLINDVLFEAEGGNLDGTYALVRRTHDYHHTFSTHSVPQRFYAANNNRSSRLMGPYSSGPTPRQSHNAAPVSNLSNLVLNQDHSTNQQELTINDASDTHVFPCADDFF